MSDDYGSPIERCGSPNYEKDPNDIEFYTFNWAPEINDDTIATSEFLLPDGLTKEDESYSVERSTGTIKVSGGQSGRIYRITHRITTVTGRQLDQSIRILVRDL